MGRPLFLAVINRVVQRLAALMAAGERMECARRLRMESAAGPVL